MAKQFNFNINSTSPFSKLCNANDITDFINLCHYLKLLPYGRTSNRADYYSIIKENKGTCSSKHAFIKEVALENNINTIKLYIGLYKMNNANTKGVGRVLNKYNLKYIPEAHTYLKINESVVDVTRTVSSGENFINTLIKEAEILPNQTIDYKVNWHKNYLKQWIVKNKIVYSFNNLWQIRELCILAISQ